MNTEEPRIHSHLIDVLPDDYKGLNDKVDPDKSIDCDCCGVIVHAFNNECMQTWIETETGNYCTVCLKLGEVLEGDANNDWPLENDLTPRKKDTR